MNSDQKAGGRARPASGSPRKKRLDDASMATTLLTLSLTDGQTLQAEVSAAVSSPKRGIRALVTPPAVDFAGEVEKVRTIAEQIHGGLAKIKPLPSSYQVSFGITLKADAGVVLAKAGAEANFTITLTWGK